MGAAGACLWWWVGDAGVEVTGAGVLVLVLLMLVLEVGC